MAIPLAHHRFTLDEYHEMARAGVLAEDDRVELVEGEIVDMTPIGLRHAAAVNLLTQRLVLGCGRHAIVQPQGPFRLPPGSELQPDLLVLKPRDDFYRNTAPLPDDVLLLVEVADASLPYDRRVKLPLYAGARVAEVWLVDLGGERVEVHRDPSPAGYRTIETRFRGDRLAPGVFPEVSLSVDELFG